MDDQTFKATVQLADTARIIFSELLSECGACDETERMRLAGEARELAKVIAGVVPAKVDDEDGEEDPEAEEPETDSLDDLIAEARRLLDGFAPADVKGHEEVSFRSKPDGWRVDMTWFHFLAASREEAMRGMIANMRLELENVARQTSSRADRAKAVLEGKP